MKANIGRIPSLNHRLVKVRGIMSHYSYGLLLRDEFADERRKAKNKFHASIALIERIEDEIFRIKEDFRSSHQVTIQKVAMEYLDKYGFDRALSMLRRKIGIDDFTEESAIAVEAVAYLKKESSRLNQFNTHKMLAV